MTVHEKPLQYWGGLAFVRIAAYRPRCLPTYWAGEWLKRLSPLAKPRAKPDRRSAALEIRRHEVIERSPTFISLNRNFLIHASGLDGRNSP